MNNSTRPRTGRLLPAPRDVGWRAVACSALLVFGVSGSTLSASQATFSSQTASHRALVEIFDLDAQGHETPLSLKGVDWTPASDAVLLSGASGELSWFPLLPLSSQSGAVTDSASIAVGAIGKNGARRAALGANPIHDFVRPRQSSGRADAQTEIWLEQVIAWLLDSDMPFAPVDAPSLNITMAHLAGPSGDTEDAVTRGWFISRGTNVSVSAPWSCDGPRLVSCLDKADLLVIGPGHRTSPADGYSAELAERNTQGASEALRHADAAKVPVLYLHEGAAGSQFAKAVLGRLSLSTHENHEGLSVARASGSDLHEVSVGGAPIIAAANP